MLVVGDKEVADGTLSVRSRTGGDHGPQAVAAFLEAALSEMQQRRAA
jgi:threonyl-tRNA synthetase